MLSISDNVLCLGVVICASLVLCFFAWAGRNR